MFHLELLRLRHPTTTVCLVNGDHRIGVYASEFDPIIHFSMNTDVGALFLRLCQGNRFLPVLSSFSTTGQSFIFNSLYIVSYVSRHIFMIFRARINY